MLNKVQFSACYLHVPKTKHASLVTLQFIVMCLRIYMFKDTLGLAISFSMPLVVYTYLYAFCGLQIY